MRLVRPVAAACLLVCTAAAPEAPFSFDSTPGRLPKAVVPEDYVLQLAPDVASQTFDGQVTIRIRVREPVRRIVLNARDLSISAASLTTGTGARTPLQPELDEKAETLSFALPKPLRPGGYTLDIAYRGRIAETNNGLYQARYRTTSGEKVMLATQLQPTDARRVLPCWDEPVFRATFQTSVDLPASWTAYSNMPVETFDVLPAGLKRTRFARTPRMASYLLVLVAGELERLEGEQDGVSIGIVATEGKRQAGAHALSATRQLLKYYNDYFGVAYPLPKLDQLAVAATAGFGAMENWGGIVYDESILLFDPRTSADRTKKIVYVIVAHEMAHQWFGNLVTMAWWNNLWLNEGFASWMGYKATDRFNPEWDIWQSALDAGQYAMRLDARKTTHPIQQPVQDEADALRAFDVITYNKGLAFLRMLEAWLGEDAFRAAMREYMERHQYSSTTTADLWKALEDGSGQPVRRMAAGWTEQPGFPLIRVAARCVRGVRKIELSQERFRVDGEPGRQRWVVPVGISTGGPATFEVLETRARTIERKGCDAPVIIDPDGVGYFRVEYAPELLSALASDWSALRLSTRRKVLMDAWVLAGVGRMTLSQYLGLVRRARNDHEPAVWDEITRRLLELDGLAVGEPIRQRLQAFGVSVLRPRLATLGWEPRPGDSQLTLELRPKLIAALGTLGDAAVRAEAQARFKRFLKDPTSLSASIAAAIIQVAGRYADKATHEALVARLRGAVGSEEQARYLRGLASVLDASLARETLALTLDRTLPAPVVTAIPGRVALEHPQMVWDFAKLRHKEILARLNSLQLNDYFGEVVAGSVDVRTADDLEKWGAEHLPAGARTSLERSADEIRFNARMKARLLPQLEAELAVEPQH